MFGKQNVKAAKNNDAELLLEVMDNVIAGDFNKVDTSAFSNPVYAEKINDMISRRQTTILLCVLMKQWNLLVIIHL